MGKSARKDAETEVPMLRVLGEVVRRELREFVVVAGMNALATMLEQERIDACGPRPGTRTSPIGGHDAPATRPANWCWGSARASEATASPHSRRRRGRVAELDRVRRRGSAARACAHADARRCLHASVRSLPRSDSRRRANARHVEERGEPAVRGDDRGANGAVARGAISPTWTWRCS